MKSIIESLGDCRFRSPLPHMDCQRAKFKLDSDQIVCDDRLNRENVHAAAEEPSLTFEVAGPRERQSILIPQIRPRRLSLAAVCVPA